MNCHFDKIGAAESLTYVVDVVPQDGLRSTQALRAFGYSRLIIGLTGNAMEDDVKVFVSSGADAVLAKPLQIGHLDGIVKYVKESGCRSRLDGKEILFDLQ